MESRRRARAPVAIRRGCGSRERVDLRVDRGYLMDIFCFIRADAVDASRHVHCCGRDGDSSLGCHDGPPGIRRSREARIHRAGLQRRRQRDSVQPVGNAAVEHIVELSRPDCPDRSGARPVRRAGRVPGCEDTGTFAGVSGFIVIFDGVADPVLAVLRGPCRQEHPVDDCHTPSAGARSREAGHIDGRLKQRGWQPATIRQPPASA